MAEAPPVTRDAFFGGRLVLDQPAKGHRSGTDAVLLAAAVPLDFAGLCYDMGAGVGAAGLGIALLRPMARVVLVENDVPTLAFAAGNVAVSGLAERVVVAPCDLLDAPARRAALPARAALVVTNPPFYDSWAVRPSPDATRRAAHVLRGDATLADWIAACLDRLADKGTLIVIHVAAALPPLLAALARDMGGVAVKPVLPRAGAPAHRVIVRATKGSRAPFTLAAPLVLHAEEGFTPEAERLHRGEAALGLVRPV